MPITCCMHRLVARSDHVHHVLQPAIDKWLAQLPMLSTNDKQQKTCTVRNGDAVSFKRTYSTRDEDRGWFEYGRVRHQWLSCWGVGSNCRYATCPGVENPMERGTQFGRKVWKCKGEVFWIHNINSSDDVIRTCSVVGIQYGSDEGNGGNWWLGARNHWWYRRSSTTRRCSGRMQTSMINSGCDSEAWTIYARGKECNVAVTDHDVIVLKSLTHEMTPMGRLDTHNGWVEYPSWRIGPWGIDSICWGHSEDDRYVIFRSGENHDDCKTRLPKCVS